MNTMPWTLPPFVSEPPPDHRVSQTAEEEYECSCGEELLASSQSSAEQVARWHADGSLGPEAVRRFVQTYLRLIDMAWLRAGRYFTAMASMDPSLRSSLEGARLVALDPFGAHFTWPDERRACLPYEWLVAEDFEAALAAWRQAAVLPGRPDRELPPLEAIEAARAALKRSRHLDEPQRGRRAAGAWSHLVTLRRRSGRAAGSTASAGLGLPLDSPEAALADIWHRSLFHGPPTGNHAAADREEASRRLRDLIPPGWKLVPQEPDPGSGVGDGER
jgi:hypothetical protein